jgi:hypothetical protein
MTARRGDDILRSIFSEYFKVVSTFIKICLLSEDQDATGGIRTAISVIQCSSFQISWVLVCSLDPEKALGFRFVSSAQLGRSRHLNLKSRGSVLLPDTALSFTLCLAGESGVEGLAEGMASL